MMPLSIIPLYSYRHFRMKCVTKIILEEGFSGKETDSRATQLWEMTESNAFVIPLSCEYATEKCC